MHELLKVTVLAAVGIPASYLSVKIALMAIFQNSIIYCSYWPINSRKEVASPSEYDIPFEHVKINHLNGWRLINPYHSKTSSLLIYFGGNAGNIGHRLPIFKSLLMACPINILAVDYTGYGLNRGKNASESALQKDALAIYARACEFSNNLFILGHSLGASVGCFLASQKSTEKYFKGLILENSFTSIDDMLKMLYPKWTPFHHCGFLLWNHWPTDQYIKYVKCPIMFLVSEKDELIPPSMSQKIAMNILPEVNRSTVIIPNAYHETAWENPQYVQSIGKFISSFNA